MSRKRKLKLPEGTASKVIQRIHSNKYEIDKSIIHDLEEIILMSESKDECLESIRKYKESMKK